MKKQLSYYLHKLEEQGIDTSVFNLELNGVVLSPKELEESKKFVGQSFINSKMDIVHDNALLCFRMIMNQNYDIRRNCVERGLNSYIRNAISYDYIFTFIERGLNSRGFERELFDTFFTKEVLIKVLEHYNKKLYSTENSRELFKKILDSLKLLRQIDGKAFSSEYKSVIKNRKVLKSTTTKPGDWKDAYKGYMSFCAIKYLNDKGIVDVDLEQLIRSYKNEYWKLYNVLTELIDVEKYCKEMGDE